MPRTRVCCGAILAALLIVGCSQPKGHADVTPASEDKIEGTTPQAQELELRKGPLLEGAPRPAPVAPAQPK